MLLKHETDRGAQGAACCWLIVTTFRRYRSHTTPFTHSQHVRRRFPVYSQSHNQHPSQLQSVSSLGKETWRLSALTPHSPRPRPGNLRPTPRGCGSPAPHSARGRNRTLRSHWRRAVFTEHDGSEVVQGAAGVLCHCRGSFHLRRDHAGPSVHLSVRQLTDVGRFHVLPVMKVLPQSLTFECARGRVCASPGVPLGAESPGIRSSVSRFGEAPAPLPRQLPHLTSPPAASRSSGFPTPSPTLVTLVTATLLVGKWHLPVVPTACSW